MTNLQKPARGDNPASPEISAAITLRLHRLRERFGLAGPYARAVCDLAFGALFDGGRHD
jgi:hypothetical protein